MLLNKLKETVESYQSSTETQTYWAAAIPPATEMTLMTRVRRVRYTITRYEGGSYIAAKAKADELETNPNITDVAVTEFEDENGAPVYTARGTLKEVAAWGAWY